MQCHLHCIFPADVRGHQPLQTLSLPASRAAKNNRKRAIGGGTGVLLSLWAALFQGSLSPVPSSLPILSSPCPSEWSTVAPRANLFPRGLTWVESREQQRNKPQWPRRGWRAPKGMWLSCLIWVTMPALLCWATESTWPRNCWCWALL